MPFKSAFSMPDGLDERSYNDEMPPEFPKEMGGDPNAGGFDTAEAAAPDRGPGPYPGGGGEMVAMLQAGLATLAPEELQILDQAITPEVAAIVAKIDPSLGGFLSQFAGPSDAELATQQMAMQAAAAPPPAPGGGSPLDMIQA
jgi:hypothetical protein